MKRKQSGVSLSGLLVSAVILAMLALLGMKVAPEYMEYFQILKVVKTISNDPGASNSVADVRKAFERYAAVDNIEAITSQDLEVSKEGGALVISFSYERRVPLFKNVSLMFDFEGSSQE
jgi:Tfp pilus assembly protein PilE